MPSEIDLAAFSEHLRTCRCARATGGRGNYHTIFGARLFFAGILSKSVFASLSPRPCSEPSLVS
jgi:hypothetical protein